MSSTPQDSVAKIVTCYREEVAHANEVLDTCTDLAAQVPRPQPGSRRAPSLR